MLTFVWRSFYAMRIHSGGPASKAEPEAAK
jgi:hypothetical protein